MSDLKTISKQTGISIALAITLLVLAFYVGGFFYQVNTKLEYMDRKLLRIENLIFDINKKI